jgi:DNA-binding protein H-NS
MPKLSVDALKIRIADLQKKLAAAESSKAPAIKKVKALMKKLGVTAADLTSEDSGAKSPGKRRGRPNKTMTEKVVRATSGRKVAIKYRDEKGNTWTGRGKTPRWLVEAEKLGKTREQFAV